MDASDWLEVVRREYLEDFIPAGGAAVKCVVPEGEAEREAVRERLRAAALEGGFQRAEVDATETKIHLVDHLFFAVARQVDWDALARSFLRRYLAEAGFRLPAAGGEDAPGAAPLTLAALEAVNDFPGPVFHGEVRRGLANRLYRDGAMTREFRLAMLHLCLAQLDPADDPDLAESVRRWLRGELRLISGVKRALIFQRIARHNARHVLGSLAHWLKCCGRSGLVLLLDITRYGDATRPRDRGPGLYYSPAACLDLYEVLRQLIDATDDLTSCFTAVLAGPELLLDDRRGLQRYQALFLRVADEVRDRYRPNPRSALVRLAPAPAAALTR
jgi:P-loop Domain of unknown function (DUF2791)